MREREKRRKREEGERKEGRKKKKERNSRRIKLVFAGAVNKVERWKQVNCVCIKNKWLPECRRSHLLYFSFISYFLSFFLSLSLSLCLKSWMRMKQREKEKRYSLLNFHPYLILPSPNFLPPLTPLFLIIGFGIPLSFLLSLSSLSLSLSLY